MALLFGTSPKYLLTSESVTEGHPDKLCDQISDAVLDAALAGDHMSRVACETVATKNLVMVTGEITSKAHLDFNEIARQVMLDIGYTDVKYGLDGNSCGVMAHVSQQSADISVGVTTSLEHRTNGDDDARRSTGAGDQGMMVGFACNETESLMPLTVDLSHRLVERLSAMRKDGTIPYLGPDGKSQVTVEYRYGKPHRVEAVVISTQHEDQEDRGAFTEIIRQDILEHVIKPVVPSELLDNDTKYYVNPSGWFVIGGPQGDTGLTGRKILVDTYGGIARHGGGAFSGKDPTKVDRSGAYAARYVAKNLVAAGLADPRGDHRFLRHRRGPAHLRLCRNFRHQPPAQREDRRIGPDPFRFASWRDNRGPGPPASHLWPDGRLWTLRPRRPRPALGEDR